MIRCASAWIILLAPSVYGVQPIIESQVLRLQFISLLLDVSDLTIEIMRLFTGEGQLTHQAISLSGLLLQHDYPVCTLVQCGWESLSLRIQSLQQTVCKLIMEMTPQLLTSILLSRSNFLSVMIVISSLRVSSIWTWSDILVFLLYTWSLIVCSSTVSDSSVLELWRRRRTVSTKTLQTDDLHLWAGKWVSGSVQSVGWSGDSSLSPPVSGWPQSAAGSFSGRRCRAAVLTPLDRTPPPPPPDVSEGDISPALAPAIITIVWECSVMTSQASLETFQWIWPQVNQIGYLLSYAAPLCRIVDCGTYGGQSHSLNEFTTDTN